MNRNFISEIETLQAHVEKDSWAQGFLDSLHSQIKISKRSLSKKQVAILDRIKKENSTEAKLAAELWEADYRKNHREDALIVARYYRTTGYFKTASQSIIDYEDYTPNQSLFNKMCKNKYALKLGR